MTVLNEKAILRRIIEILGLIFCFYIVGTGIGFWQGYVAGVGDASGALVGGPVAVLTGLLIYYLVLRRTITFLRAVWVTSGAALAGIATAALLKVLSHGDAGWFSLFATPIAALLLTLGIGSRGRRG